MKFKSLLFVIVACLSFITRGQHLDKFPTEASTVLWKIEGKKVKKECYIFGTIHFIDREQFYFPDELSILVAKSKQVVLEIGNMNQQEIIPLLILEKGSLFDFFTAEQTDSIFNWAKENMNMDSTRFKLSFGGMKPLAVAQVIAAQESEVDMISYDLTIQNIATYFKTPILGLETVAQQMALFDNMDTIAQQRMVMDAIKGGDDDGVLNELFTIYLKQNVDELYEYVVQSGEALSTEELLDKRNHNWIPQIEQLIKKKRTFIAVGAGHLGGENGVLRLLEKQGYKLTPIPF